MPNIQKRNSSSSNFSSTNSSSNIASTVSSSSPIQKVRAPSSAPSLAATSQATAPLLLQTSPSSFNSARQQYQIIHPAKFKFKDDEEYSKRGNHRSRRLFHRTTNNHQSHSSGSNFNYRIVNSLYRIYQSALEALGSNSNSNSNNSAASSASSTDSASSSAINSHNHNMTNMTNDRLSAILSTQLQKVTSGFHSLRSSPSELWKAYLLKFLDSYAYFSFSLVFTIFLSHDFGLTDVQAGSVYGAWGALITIFGLFTGTLIDNLGVAKSLRIGFCLSFATRLTLFLCTSKRVLYFCCLVALPLANCLGIPVLTVGIRRYTNEENRGFAFGLFYVVMNVGALLAGPLVDVLTIYYNGKEAEAEAAAVNDDDDGGGGGENSTDTAAAWVMTTNRAIILSGVVANFFAVFVAFTVREIKVDAKNAAKKPLPVPSFNNNIHNSNNNNNNKPSPIPLEEPNDDDIINTSASAAGATSAFVEGGNNNMKNNATTSPKISSFQPMKGSTFQILSETVRTPNFRRFLLVCLLTLNVRMVFRHLDGTLPKYMMREFGADTPKGLVYSINPALIIILVPIISAATTTVDPLVMIHRGTYISALSVFFLALSTSLPACVLFVATLSIGEALWSPRLYDYTMSVAQEGREGTYMALSSAPLFLAKLPVGFLSGLLLQRYCPETLEEGEVRHSKTMWWIIGLSTIVSPIMITLLWGYISGGERVRSDSIDVDRVESGGMSGIAMRIKEGERGVQDNDDVYFYANERGLFRNEEDGEDEIESSYQHRPLTTNISLPRVRVAEHTLM